MSGNDDRHPTRADCGHDFVPSAREQEFYREGGFRAVVKAPGRATLSWRA